MTLKSLMQFLGLVSLAWLGVYGLSELGYYFILKDVPVFHGEIVEAAKKSSVVTEKIGPYQGYSYEYNEKDLIKDTLAYRVDLRGTDGWMKLTGYALKKGTSWTPAQIDTLYSED
ncbi:hypothetical protein SAMN00120144_0625 [Hymenobacter roseosalivarius DSM 11622]|uniref:Uncharacterized protein n=1 Tax=Hymenobacter roseosalivarius DSM 11622 TaxID=645990 RepID=A0A1W1VCM6_9BACT|nr:hypothetical protein [Hymenobacter roseosalivarius]SMB91056.1 hypothetical protein SAMN00120144_0625 [Hymenobacter roseosalivarius DSM 11622]